MCLSLMFQLYVMSEMSKWIDIHFAMSKINKGKILKLSLVSKSDIFNVWTQQVTDVASKEAGGMAWLYSFSEICFLA